MVDLTLESGAPKTQEYCLKLHVLFINMTRDGIAYRSMNPALYHSILILDASSKYPWI
jgi:hypothetical protein